MRIHKTLEEFTCAENQSLIREDLITLIRKKCLLKQKTCVEMHVARMSLDRFLDGEDVNYATLARIEEFVLKNR